jgi:hypothetical protein
MSETCRYPASESLRKAVVQPVTTLSVREPYEKIVRLDFIDLTQAVTIRHGLDGKGGGKLPPSFVGATQ